MCTVTYIPLEEGFVLTSNRDEAPSRAANIIFQEERNGNLLTYPRDEGAGGTWIAASSSGQLVCLLNGAYEKHERNPPYKRSRGLMVLSFFDYNGIHNFVSEYDFEGMEPFTFLMIEEDQLWELRWTGTEKTLKRMDTKSRHIWSSATLYDGAMRSQRKGWFEEWEEKNDWSPASILKFHRHGGIGDPNVDIVMNRNNIVRSVSITQVLMSDISCMSHFDLMNGSIKKKGIKVNNEKVCG